jgi:hypothetical protein
MKAAVPAAFGPGTASREDRAFMLPYSTLLPGASEQNRSYLPIGR